MSLEDPQVPDRIRYVFSASPISWGVLIALLTAVVTGVYGYGELSQRVTSLEELRPLQVAAKLATIEAYQARTVVDLGRVQADIAELRRELGAPRRWDRLQDPPMGSH